MLYSLSYTKKKKIIHEKWRFLAEDFISALEMLSYSLFAVLRQSYLRFSLVSHQSQWELPSSVFPGAKWQHSAAFLSRVLLPEDCQIFRCSTLIWQLVCPNLLLSLCRFSRNQYYHEQVSVLVLKSIFFHVKQSLPYFKIPLPKNAT